MKNTLVNLNVKNFKCDKNIGLSHFYILYLTNYKTSQSDLLVFLKQSALLTLVNLLIDNGISVI